jgi:putative endonuclease
MSNTYCVYILANRSRGLYTGMSNNLDRRMIEHREELVPGFTSRYRIFRLVHFELFGDVRDAIAREKEIKGWRREKKIRLIEGDNPTWADLAEQLPAKYQKADPSRRSPKPGDRVRDDNQARARTPNPATAPPVIPNRAGSQTDPTVSLRRTTHDANTRGGSAFAPFNCKRTRK